MKTFIKYVLLIILNLYLVYSIGTDIDNCQFGRAAISFCIFLYIMFITLLESFEKIEINFEE